MAYAKLLSPKAIEKMESMIATGTHQAVAAPILDLKLVLTCDGKHGLLTGDRYEETGQDFIAMRHRATARGWRRIDGGSWRGPCCKGAKAVDE